MIAADRVEAVGAEVIIDEEDDASDDLGILADDFDFDEPINQRSAPVASALRSGRCGIPAAAALPGPAK